MSGWSVGVGQCMKIVKRNPVEAKGFAEEDATKEDLEAAIDSISINSRNKNKFKPGFKAGLKSRLKKCYGFRKVKSTFKYHNSIF